MPQMIPNILRNFRTRPATRRYPAEIRPSFPEVRGELVNNISECIFCGTCSRKCPSQCISVDKKEATWELMVFACVTCGICQDHCPVHCLSFKPGHRPVTDQRLTVRLKGEIKKKKDDVPGNDHPSDQAGE